MWLTILAVRWAFLGLPAVTRPVVEPVLDRISDAAGADLGSRVLGARVHRGLDQLLARVPLVNTIYVSARKLMTVVESTPEKAERVVLIESERSGSTSIGFATQVLTDAATGREFAAVFVPTTPNPTSGALELVPIEDVRPSDISVDEAMSFVVSGGAVAPARFAAASGEAERLDG